MSNIPRRISKVAKSYLDNVRERIDSQLDARERTLAELTDGRYYGETLDDAALKAERSVTDASATGRDGATMDARPSPAGGASRASAAASYGDNSDSLMQRAQDRIEAARRDLEARREVEGRPASQRDSSETRRDISPDLPAPDGSTAATGGSSVAAAVVSNEDANARDYRVLGVPVGGDLAQVQSAFEKLSRRCDPRRFPDGSQEQKDAERILERVNVSYEALRNRLDPTVNRFGKLEFE